MCVNNDVDKIIQDNGLINLKIIYGHPFSASELLKKSKEKDMNDYERIVDALKGEVLKLKRDF